MYIMPYGKILYAVYKDNSEIICAGTYDYCVLIIKHIKPKKYKTVTFNKYVYVY